MSKSITIENYEEFALDFIDGNLSPEMQQAFEAFLLLHPNVADEVESMREFSLPDFDAELSDDFKQELKIEIKPIAGIDESNYEESFALAADKDLNPELAKNAARFADENPALMGDFIAYQNTKVKPDLSIVFKEKSAIKQPVTLWVNYGRPALRVAAAIAMIVGIASIIRFSNNEIYQPRNQQPNSFADVQIDPIKKLSVINEISDSSSSTIEVVEPSIQNEPVYMAEYKPENVQPIRSIKVNQIEEEETHVLPEERYIASLEVGHQEATKPEENAKTNSPAFASANIPGKAAVLNVTQFIGQRFLGIEPKNAETPMDLLRESIATINDRKEIVTVNNNEQNQSSKHTFALAGGRFEITRVAHK